MHNRPGTAIAALACLCGLASGGALGADFGGSDWSYVSHDKTIVLRGGFGALGIQADEYVFNLAGSPDTTSHLIW